MSSLDSPQVPSFAVVFAGIQRGLIRLQRIPSLILPAVLMPIFLSWLLVALSLRL